MIIEFDGAFIEEQGVKFAIIVVQNSVIESQSQSANIQEGYQWLFGDLPIVLAAQDVRGNFRYRGRNDLVKFLLALDPSRIPWKRYTVKIPDGSDS